MPSPSERGTSTSERLGAGAAFVSVASASASVGRSAGNFFREAKLCPDGSAVLVASEDRKLDLFVLPAENVEPLVSSWTYAASDALLSFQWFPGARVDQPAMFSFVAAVKDHPIHLLDGSDHRLRASYPIVDHRERFIAPHSMVFSLDGTSLYAGFENAIEIFDVACAGAAGQRIKTTPTRNSPDGQKGIISSLAFSPTRDGLLAAGSFGGSVGLYDASVGDGILLSLLGTNANGGITKVAFNPVSDQLYTASRLSDTVEVWDIRYGTEPLGTYPRKGQTNQRLGFDVDPTGAYIAIGDKEGTVSIYSTAWDEGQPIPVHTIQVAKDAIGTVAFHPTLPRLLTCSGSRSFSPHDSESEEEEVNTLKGLDSMRLWEF